MAKHNSIKYKDFLNEFGVITHTPIQNTRNVCGQFFFSLICCCPNTRLAIVTGYGLNLTTSTFIHVNAKGCSLFAKWKHSATPFKPIP